jgi:hypothetical protein
MIPLTAYKVRDPKTGLFQKAGAGGPRKNEAQWSKSGKTWTTARHLTLHFSMLREYKVPIDPTWEVIELKIVPGMSMTVGAYLASRKK